ncbi:hypothetical protein FACS189485_20650 [Spirochaetia bacterium]|nr:hypothetical protein FACS189485_20650 [Spirochaetia bacterium]
MRKKYPDEYLQAAFAAVETDTQDGGELYALRRFHRWMQYFEKTSGGETGVNLTDEAVDYAYERPALEADRHALQSLPGGHAPLRGPDRRGSCVGCSRPGYEALH